MRMMVVAAQNAGAGKTTSSSSIFAVAAMQAAESVAIVDADPQQTGIAWGETREAHDPEVVATTQIEAAKSETEKGGYTVLLTDTPPVAGAATLVQLRAAHFALILCDRRHSTSSRSTKRCHLSEPPASL